MSAVSGGDEPMGPAGAAGPRKRADARKNEQTLVAAAAEAFVAVGVEAPDRDIATRAGVGMGTIYRHFPTRADLVIAVYRHQVEACAQAGPALHGLAAALQSGDSRFEPLHAYFLDRLVPVCAQLLGAAVAADEIGPGVEAYGLMLAIGNLCIGGEDDGRYDARRMAGLLIAGLRQPCLPASDSRCLPVTGD